MDDPAEIIAATLASVGLFVAIVAANLVVVPLTAAAGLGLAVEAIEARHRRRPRSYHQAHAALPPGDDSSPWMDRPPALTR